MSHRYAAQQATILVHLKKHKSITQLQATDLYKITRLADIKYKLNKKLIDQEVVNVPQWSGKTYYAKYELRPRKEAK